MTAKDTAAKANSDFEVITPPDTIKSKVTFGPGGVDPAMLEKAEAVIASLKGSYLNWVHEDLSKIQAAFDKAIADGPSARLKNQQAIFNVAHDIKGQGGSFNYHLMTQIGHLLCRFLEAIERSPHDFGEDMDVIKLHLDSMRLVIGEGMEGDGGNEGRRMLRGLEAVIEKLLKKKIVAPA